MARTSKQTISKRYQDSIEQPETFWAAEAQNIDWIKAIYTGQNTSFNQDHFKIEWFADGELNVSTKLFRSSFKR